MSIERSGAFIEVVDEDGLRNLVWIAAIQRVFDVDEFRQESHLTIAGRIILIRVPFYEVREIIVG